MKKIILPLLIAVCLFANVKVSVNKQQITQGEEVVFTITADGKDVKMPDIQKIGPYNIQGTSNTENIIVINGQMKTQISRSYIFYPTKSLTIPSFKIKVDGKIFNTNPIKITVKPLTKTNNKNYDLNIFLDKNESFLGESRILTIQFKKSLNVNPQSIQIQKPILKDFLVKKLSTTTTKKDNYEITKYKFLIIPQKSGKFNLGPIIANIGILKQQNPFDNLFSTAFITYKKIVSNALTLNVKPIPQNSTFGNFKIGLISDTNESLANTPVKVKLFIKGCGDFYNLPDIKLNLPNATVYAKKPILNISIKNNKLCGIYEKDFTVISPSDIKISPIKITEFDKKAKTIKSNPLFIKIKNSIQTPTTTKSKNFTTITKTKTVYKYKTNYLFIIIAFLSGILVTILAVKFIKIPNKEKDIIAKIKKANQKELFKLLLAYSDNKKIEQILKKLEENIYKGAKNKIDKKEIIKIINENNL